MTVHAIKGRCLPAACLFALVLINGCDGPHEKAGKQADKAAGVKYGVLEQGPQQRLGALQDRSDRDQVRAVDARADAVEARAKAVRATADHQAGALEAQAHGIRNSAKVNAASLDRQADEIRGK